MGTIEGSLPGVITSSVISTTAPSARAVTFCAIGNAYGGLPSNLMFPMDRSLLLLLLLLIAGTSRRSGHRHRCVAFRADIARSEERRVGTGSRARTSQILLSSRADLPLLCE